MTPIKILWLEPTDVEKRWLRRYRSSSVDHKCAANGSYCNAMFEFGEGPCGLGGSETRRWGPPNDDPRWPAKCEACGQPFSAGDPFQEFARRIYICKATGLRTTLRDAPSGVMIGHRIKPSRRWSAARPRSASRPSGACAISMLRGARLEGWSGGRVRPLIREEDE